MNAWLLAMRGMRHYWRTHLGVLLGIACATTVLCGALSVGDSVRLSLLDQSLQRIGKASSVLAAGDRFVQADLGDRIATAITTQTKAETRCVPVMQLPGVAANDDGSGRTGIVDVFGIDDAFFALSKSGSDRKAPGDGQAILNQRLADQLGAGPGEEVVVRIEKPSLMPQEATMATVDEVSFALRVKVLDVVDEREFGRFGLRASQVPPFNLFVSLGWLQQELSLPGRANMLLTDASVDLADQALRSTWTIDDAELQLSEQGEGTVVELTSSRIFLDQPIVDAAQKIAPNALGVVTYFVNSLKTEATKVPYSMVSAIGPIGADAPQARGDLPAALAKTASLVPATTRDDQIICNQWLADKLNAKAGDAIEMAYWVMNEQLQFEERTHKLAVRSIVPLAGAAADPSLMPAFPGLAEAKSCREWEPGIPVDLQRLDDADQQYWEQHKGTPKAFVTLKTGRQLWSNRFGTLTAIRTAAADSERLREQLPREVDPKTLNLFFQDIRGPALAAGVPATDFGALYFGLSFFLIIAALLLAAMLFVFGVEQRQREIGTLLAVGFEPRSVRWLFAREALVLATVGSLIGAIAGAGYTHGVLAALDTLWRDTIGQTTLTAHILPTSVALGAGYAILAAILAIAWAMRRAFQKPAVELLGASSGVAPTQQRSRGLTGALAIAAALGAGWLIWGAEPNRTTSAFFGGGTLLLISALLTCRNLLAGLGQKATTTLRSVAALGVRNCGRRPGRSLATVALLASGTFLVVSIQANRLRPPSDPTLRSAGTGGFTLFGRTTLPVLRDLQSEAGRDAYGLDDDELADVAIVPLRVRNGDDASCLNLATAQNPQLVGVDPTELARRACFRFTRQEPSPQAIANPWLLLDQDFGDDVVPAIGDGGSVAWALHKKIGDSLTYRDETGDEFEVRIVGTVADSILQGNLVIADHHMQERFPSVSGYRMFLIDAPTNQSERVSKDLSRALLDVGLEVTPSCERLAAFQSIQNTYLVIFQMLGGLGLLLGTVGLGIVVLRNALERRGELAIARAVGFDQSAVRRLIFYEHSLLLALGLAVGTLAAALALLPAWRAERPISAATNLTFLLAITVSGVFWVWLASTLATRGRTIDGLRGE